MSRKFLRHGHHRGNSQGDGCSFSAAGTQFGEKLQLACAVSPLQLDLTVLVNDLPTEATAKA
jgi:hypothetical protein